MRRLIEHERARVNAMLDQAFDELVAGPLLSDVPDTVWMHPDTAKALWPEHATLIDATMNEGWGLFGFGGPF